MWTPCMLREDIVDGDVAHQGLRELDTGELLYSFVTLYDLHA
jgi:hypothetical protein